LSAPRVDLMSAASPATSANGMDRLLTLRG
jgi:hypothetical protein